MEFYSRGNLAHSAICSFYFTFQYLSKYKHLDFGSYYMNVYLQVNLANSSCCWNLATKRFFFFLNRNIYSFRVLDNNFSFFVLYITTPLSFVLFFIKTSNSPNLLLDRVPNYGSLCIRDTMESSRLPFFLEDSGILYWFI